MKKATKKTNTGKRVVYAAYIRKNGRIIRPKNGKVFRFEIDAVK